MGLRGHLPNRSERNFFLPSPGENAKSIPVINKANLFNWQGRSQKKVDNLEEKQAKNDESHSHERKFLPGFRKKGQPASDSKNNGHHSKVDRRQAEIGEAKRAFFFQMVLVRRQEGNEADVHFQGQSF